MRLNNKVALVTGGARMNKPPAFIAMKKSRYSEEQILENY